MKIAIVGAGLAGVSSTRVLTELGHDVTVFESESEVGGVWATSRRYPGLSTQNPGSTYHFSEMPMPSNYPEWPSGKQVQEYVESYVSRFKLWRRFQLNCRVESARFNADEQKWTLDVTTCSASSGEPISEQRSHSASCVSRSFDYLIVANGVFSRPKLPDIQGYEEWAAAGGRLLHTSELNDLNTARDKAVVVIGYGKSACDAAVALAGVSRSTTVVARSIIWKIPRKLAGVLNFKHLFFTRLGEGLFEWSNLRGVDKFLHGRGKPLRNLMLNTVQSVIERQLKLNKLGLHPGKKLESIARTSISLSTEGFFEAVAERRIRVIREAEITRLVDGKAELSTGESVPCDLLIAGTGFHQTVPILNDADLAQMTCANGDLRLYRGILPVTLKQIAFIGYNSSLMCQLSCETSAMWLAEYLRGGLALPDAATMNARIDSRLNFHRTRMDGSYFRGTYLVPFSIRPIDELLGDANINISRWARFKQWFGYVKPGVYARIYPELRRRAGVRCGGAKPG